MTRVGRTIAWRGAWRGSADRRDRLTVHLSAAVRRIVPLALIAAATVVMLAVFGAGLAHHLFPPPTGIDKCLVMNDPLTGPRGVPGSYCRGNAAESRPTGYRFNACGFRTPQSCNPAAPGVFRVVMIGSSFDFGLYVPQRETFAVLLAPILSSGWRRPIDVYNESIYKAFDGAWALRADVILQPRPNLILWPLTPNDIVPCVGPAPPPDAPEMPESGWDFSSPRQMWATAINKFTKSTEGIMLQHFLFRSDSLFLDHALMRHGEVDYLRVPATTFERACMAQFAGDFRKVAARARAARVPLVVTLLPEHEQAIMLSNGHWSKGYDPNQIGRQVRRIVEAEGVRFVDIMPRLRSVPDAGAGYLPVDGHPNSEGNRMFATLVGTQLVRTGIVQP